MQQKLAIVFSFLLCFDLFAYGVGYSAYPLKTKEKLLGGEITTITSDDGGLGIQGRYTQKFTPEFRFDAGVGFNGGDRSNRIFLGADYEILPDYMNQPKLSAKLTLSNAEEFNDRRNILSLAPVVSKGFSFWGHEAYPYAAVPFSLNLNPDKGTYESGLGIALGVTGKLPFEDYKNLTALIEADIDIDDSTTAFFLGVSYPFE